MDLTEAEAAEIVQLIVERLTECGAMDVLAGIEESRQQGFDEAFPQSPLKFVLTGSPADVRGLGTIRRRPPTSLEMLGLVLERLHQRLVVLPSIVESLRKSIGNRIVWRVDSEFVSSARREALEADVSNLLPQDLASTEAAYRAIRELIPDFLPTRTHDA